MIMIISYGDWKYLFAAISICISLLSSIVLYLAYRRSEFGFMSPKKYKKAIFLYEKNKVLFDLLKKIDNSNTKLKPDDAIDKAIELIYDHYRHE